MSERPKTKFCKKNTLIKLMGVETTKKSVEMTRCRNDCPLSSQEPCPPPRSVVRFHSAYSVEDT